LLLLLLVVAADAPQLMDGVGVAGSVDDTLVVLADGCRGCENCVAVGLMGWMYVRSGVTALKPSCCVLTALNWLAEAGAGAAEAVD